YEAERETVAACTNDRHHQFLADALTLAGRINSNGTYAGSRSSNMEKTGTDDFPALFSYETLLRLQLQIAPSKRDPHVRRRKWRRKPVPSKDVIKGGNDNFSCTNDVSFLHATNHVCLSRFPNDDCALS